jgi:release factor glutamine methyltransferase
MYQPVDVGARALYLWGSKALQQALIPSPSRECLEIICHVLKYSSSPSSLFAKLDTVELDPILRTQFVQMIERRQRHEPLAYILGKSRFYGRDFIVGPPVLVPRPETEFLIEAVLKLAPKPGSSILDVCTGSGCIAITVKLEFPDSLVFASDLSWNALEIAHKNSLNLKAPLHLVNADLLHPVKGQWDMILSNPPYIPLSDKASLPKDVANYEPSLALFGGVTGLEISQEILKLASNLLKSGGYLMMEIGIGQSETLIDMSSKHQLELVECIYDFRGIGRILVLKRG